MRAYLIQFDDDETTVYPFGVWEWDLMPTIDWSAFAGQLREYSASITGMDATKDIHWSIVDDQLIVKQDAD
jgi:hypothetical protein